MKLIGVRGHRGAGKNTITYLLANTMEYLIDHETDFELSAFTEQYSQWCKEIQADESAVHRMNCNHVLVEGFGDGPKMMLSMLVGIDMKMMNDDYMKDHIVVNLEDFSHDVYENPGQFPLITAKDYALRREMDSIITDTYMTLRELILYFGLYVMQTAFGLNVWVKSMTANALFYNCLYPEDGDDFKIFSDVKSSSEVTYIKDRKGVMVRVERPGHEKTGGLDMLKDDDRYDYTVVIGDNLEDTAPSVVRIARDLVFINDSNEQEENI